MEQLDYENLKAHEGSEMFNDIVSDIWNNIILSFEYLKVDGLTDYQKLDIITKVFKISAINEQTIVICKQNELQEEYNKMFRQAHVLSSDDSFPSAIEKCAIELDEIKDALDKIKYALND